MKNFYQKFLIGAIGILILSLAIYIYADTVAGAPPAQRILAIRSHFPMSAAINEIDNAPWIIRI